MELSLNVAAQSFGLREDAAVWRLDPVADVLTLGDTAAFAASAQVNALPLSYSDETVANRDIS